MSLKEKILENEQELLKYFEKDYGPHIKNFVGKIKALDYDGDIVNFLSSPYLEIQKKEQYDAIHFKNMKTALDIMHDYDKSNLEYIDVSKLKRDDLVNTMSISAMAKNFNNQKGMYYNETDDILYIKATLNDGPYANKWIVRNNQMLYFLETEKYEDVYNNLQYSHKPNQICRDMIIGMNKSTTLYLFYRYNKGDRYFFAGVYKPIKFTYDNRAIILENTVKEDEYI